MFVEDNIMTGTPTGSPVRVNPPHLFLVNRPSLRLLNRNQGEKVRDGLEQ